MDANYFSYVFKKRFGVSPSKYPSGSTEVELRAVRDSAEHADGRDVYLIFEPMAAAIGIGIDVEMCIRDSFISLAEVAGSLSSSLMSLPPFRRICSFI